MKSPAFQFYADDFLAGTSDMTAAEVGAYIRLLCFQWMRGGLPQDESRLFMMARTNNEPTNEAAVRYVVGAKFILGADGLLRNERLERVRQSNQAWKEKSAIGGQASARVRLGNSKWGKKMSPARTTERTICEPPCEPQGQPLTNSPSPSPSPRERALPLPSQGTNAAEIPSWEEFLAYCQMHELPDETFAKDKFLAAQQENWAKQSNWRAYAQRCAGWWRENQTGTPKPGPAAKFRVRPPKPHANCYFDEIAWCWIDNLP